MKRSYSVLLFIVFMGACNPDPGISPIEQFNRDIEAIDKYLADNSISAYKDASGIRFSISTLGTEGLPPRQDQRVKVKYTGRLLSNGQIFDSGTIVGLLTGFIPGWTIGISRLPQGTIGKLYIPSGLAYGPNGSGSIPPNAILVFDVELEDVVLSPTEENLLDEDTVTIDAYLEENMIEAETHPSGIRYVIHDMGTGDIPTWYDPIRLTYTISIFDDETEFPSAIAEPVEGFDSRVVDFLPGMQAILQLLPEGSTATVYIPSVRGHGSKAVGTIPANSILVFEIESLELL